MKAGRKRKIGPREPSGRPQRAPLANFDRGTDFSRAKRDRYSTDGVDAIGRAYRMGLLGEHADALLDTARRIARAYWPMMGQGLERSCLGDHTGGGMDDWLLDRDERQRKIDREKRLTDTIRAVDRMGHAYRRAFDQLVIDINPDFGPKWLDSLIWHKQNGKPLPVRDVEMLDRALVALRGVMS